MHRTSCHRDVFVDGSSVGAVKWDRCQRENADDLLFVYLYQMLSTRQRLRRDAVRLYAACIEMSNYYELFHKNYLKSACIYHDFNF